jgi:plastocyanin
LTLAWSLAPLGFVGSADAATTTIVATSSAVSPKNVTVAPGTTVTFRNDDGRRHRFRTDDSAPARFDLDLDAGQSASTTLVALGTYPYRDDRDRANPAYAGTITVAASATTTTTTAGGGGATTTVPGPRRVAVQVLDRSFSPASVSVTAGSTVVWTNTSGRSHTVTADNRAFASANFGSGGTYERTFPAPGTFSYFCEIHPDMRGVVAVGAAGSPPPPPPPTPTTAAPPPPPPPPPPSGGGAVAGGSTAPATRTLQIIDFAFRPATLDARAGDTVVFANDGRAPHTATARGGAFDTGTIAAGGRRSVRLGTAGTYAFFCTIHPEMTGTVRVADASGVAPAAEPGSALGGAVGPGGSPDPAAVGEDGALASGEVAVLDLEFSPAVLEVSPGAEVVWSFQGAAPHTVTADDGSFDSGVQDQGATFAHSFDTLGSYTYYCQVHPQMTGVVKVVEAPLERLAAAPSGADPPTGRVTQSLGFGLLGGAAILGATALMLLAARRLAAAAD